MERNLWLADLGVTSQLTEQKVTSGLWKIQMLLGLAGVTLSDSQLRAIKCYESHFFRRGEKK